MGHVDTSKQSERASIRSRLARAYRVTAQLGPLLGGLTLLLAGSCTAILDINKEQCAVDTDCTDLFGPTAPYLCTDSVCTRPACNTDAECKARGGAFATSICDVSHLCAPAECTDNVQCGIGQTCDLTTNRCAKRECDTTEDCLRNSPSPTVQCTAGFCVDPTWSCIGKPDDRVHTPGETGTLKVKLLTSDLMKPVVGANWQIRVCGPTQLDPNCASPVPVPAPTYDPETGTVTITGLSYDMPVRMMFDELALKDADTQSTFIPIDFFTQKPPVGVTEVPPLRVVSRVGLAALVQSFSAISSSMGVTTPVNSSLGNIYGLLFDCQNNPAGQVQLNYTNAVAAPLDPAPLVLYFGESPIPSLTKKFSYPSGVFSTLNIPLENINVATTLIVAADAMGNPTRTRDIRADYTMRLAGFRQTTVHFYPRDYSK